MEQMENKDKLSLMNVNNLREILTVIPAAAILFLVTVMFLWMYLNRIGRLDVLVQAVGFKELFGFVTIFAVVSFCLFTLFFFLPSILLCLFASPNNKLLANFEKVNEFFIKSIPLCGFMLLVFFFFISTYTYGNVILKFFLVLFVFFLIYFFVFFWKYRSQIRLAVEVEKKTKKIALYFVFAIFIPFFSVFISTIPMLSLSVFLPTLTFSSGDNEVIQYLSVFILSVLIYLFSFIPGIFLSGGIMNIGVLQ